MKRNTNWIQQADNALMRAAKRAREVAERTNTPLHVIREGRIVKLMPCARTRRPTAGRSPDSKIDYTNLVQ